jgi:large subunit ribosomal protein L25
MEKIELEAAKRVARGKKNSGLRQEGKVPAVVYGHGLKSESVEIDAKVLERVYRDAGGNKIIALKVGEGRPRSVLIYDVQRGAARSELKHVDFYAVKMDELLKTEIPLHFTGESTAVYQDEGTLIKNLESVEVECLPGDLPESIEVNISTLDDFEKTITLADLEMPHGVKLVSEETEQLVAKVEAPRSDEELAKLDEAVVEEVPENAQEEAPVVLSEQNNGDMDRGHDKK